MKSLFATLLLAVSLVSPTAAQTAKVTVDAGSPGITVSPTLYGVFFEEINRAGDGGLYGEMVQNRSFEDIERTPIAWELSVAPDAKATWALDRAQPLNPHNPTSLRLKVESLPEKGRAAVVNRGFVGVPRNRDENDNAYVERFARIVAEQKGKGHGIGLRGGAEYVVSLHARRSGDAAGPVTVSLETADGKVLASQPVGEVGDAWKNHTVTLKPSADATDALLVVAATAPGTYHFDMVSMFPRDTFKGRANGMRKDLAEMIAAMKPAFVRFPGGCFVEGEEIYQAFRWKKTIGDIAERTGHYNLWGYQSTNGLGFHEYLQFCEDLKSEPLFVINCGMSHHAGRVNAYAVPMSEMHEYVQDALDAIEYCNGPADSKWGALRAKAGHPEPFNLKYIQIGNENGGPYYNERFALFFDAIKAKYPQMNVIANVWEGVPTNRPYDIKDEHYYMTPQWFMRHADQYDAYDRKGPRVYVGEYAVTRGCGLGNWHAALGEAAFMTGMERNGDIVTMSSYAPLLAEPAWKKWNPNAINFDGHRVYGTPSYHVQALFANHRADTILPIAVESAQSAEETPRGRIGVGTWSTQSEFKDIKVVDADGKALWQFDPAKGVEQFETSAGEWRIIDGALRQNSATAAPANAFAGDRNWRDYTLTLKARKISGSEGFLISFHSADPGTTSWWNIGGWRNSGHGIETPNIPEVRQPGNVETGRWYDVRVEVRGNDVRCFLDDKQIQQATARAPRRLYAVAGIDKAAGEVVIKAVNAGEQAVEGDVSLKGATPAGGGRAIVMSAERLEDENSFETPDKIIPREQKLENVSGPGFKHTFPPRSITVLRIKTSG